LGPLLADSSVDPGKAASAARKQLAILNGAAKSFEELNKFQRQPWRGRLLPHWRWSSTLIAAPPLATSQLPVPFDVGFRQQHHFKLFILHD